MKVEKRTQQKINWAIFGGACLFLALFFAQYFLLSDQALTGKIRNALQASLRGNGLQLRIERVHLSGLNEFTGSGLILSDAGSGRLFFAAEQVRLEFDALSFLSNYRHPEACIRKIRIIKPHLVLERRTSGWNFERYFPQTGQVMQFKATLQLEKGLVEFGDFQYGNYRLSQVAGKIDLSSYPAVFWNLKGLSNLGPASQWTSNGSMRLDQQGGRGSLTVRQGLAARAAKFLPRPFEYRIRSGLANLRLRFGWNRQNFWIEDGRATIFEAGISLPWFSRPFRVEYLQADFSPAEFKLENGRIKYGDTSIKVRGRFDVKKATFDGEVSASRLVLTDLIGIAPTIKDFAPSGTAGLDLRVNGPLSAPVWNGWLTLKQAAFTPVAGERVAGINGRLRIHDNDLAVENLQGTWHATDIRVNGTVRNLLRPDLNLTIAASEFDLKNIPWAEKFPGLELKTGSGDWFTATISGGLNRPTITGAIDFEQVTYQTIPINGFQFRFGLDPVLSTLKILDLQGSFGDGQLNAKGEIHYDNTHLQWLITGSASGLSLTQFPLKRPLAFKGIIGAEAIFRGDWTFGTPFDMGKVFGTLSSRQLDLNGVRLDEAEGIFSWDQNAFTIDTVQAKADSGRIFGYLTWRQDTLVVDINAENLRLQKFFPLGPKIPLDGLFEGSVTFEGPPSDLKGWINGTFTEATWDSRPLGDISGRLAYNDQKLHIEELRAATPTGEFVATGQVDLTGDPMLQVNLTSEACDLSGVMKWLPLDPALKPEGIARINLDLKGPLANPGLHGVIQLSNPGLMNIRLNRGEIEFEGDLRRVTLTRFELQRDRAVLQLKGDVSLEQYDLQVNCRDFDLDLLAIEAMGRRLQGLVNLEGRLTGRVNSPELTATLTGQRLRFGSLAYQQLTAAISIDTKGIKLTKVQLNEGESRLEAMGRIQFDRPLRMDLGLKATSFNLNTLLPFIELPPEISIDGKLSGTVRLVGTVDHPTIRTIGNISAGTVNTVPVAGEFDLYYTDGQVLIQKLQLTHGDGTLTASGAWESRKALKAKIRLDNFPLDVVNLFVKSPVQFNGRINSNIDLEWMANNVSGRCELTIQELYLNQNRVGNLNLGGNFSDQGLVIDAVDLVLSSNGRIRGSGYLPWPTQLLRLLRLPVSPIEEARDLNLDLALNNFPAELLNAYLPGGVKMTGGKLEGEFGVAGNLDKPLLSGRMDFNGLGAVIPALPYPITNTQASLVVQDNRIQIQQAKGVYGPGRFSLNGGADFSDLKQLKLNMTLSGTKMFYKNQFFDGYGDLNLQLTGTPSDSLISGDITIYNCKAGLLGINSSAAAEVGWNPRLDLAIKTGSNVRGRFVGLADVRVRGAVRVKGVLNNPSLEGQLSSNSGILTFYNQTFRVNTGKAIFKQEQGYIPYIEVSSSLKRPTIEFFLDIQGMLDNINISLTSQPYLSQADIFSMLNWETLRGEEPLAPKDLLTNNLSSVTDTVLGDFLYQVRQTLNIDYLYLEPDKQMNNFRLSIGNYVTDQLFISYSSRVFNQKPLDSWSLDYHFDPHLSLGYSYTLDENNQGEAYWQLMYQIRF